MARDYAWCQSRARRLNLLLTFTRRTDNPPVGDVSLVEPGTRRPYATWLTLADMRATFDGADQFTDEEDLAVATEICGRYPDLVCQAMDAISEGRVDGVSVVGIFRVDPTGELLRRLLQTVVRRTKPRPDRSAEWGAAPAVLSPPVRESEVARRKLTPKNDMGEVIAIYHALPESRQRMAMAAMRAIFEELRT